MPTDSRHDRDWEEQPLEWPRSIGRVDLLMAALHTREKRQRRRRAATAACGVVVLALVVASALQPPSESRPSNPTVIASTPVLPYVVRRPEQRVLPDGSMVDLKAGAEISVDFGPDRPGVRRVVLLQGEAHFQVSKNPARPFLVEAGGVEFRAVGTAFSVTVASDSVKMLVTEGRVAVARETSQDLPATVTKDVMSEKASVLVGVGERVVIDVTKTATGSTPEVMPTTTSEMAEMLAWRSPFLELNEMKLGDVVDLLGQYSGRRLNLGSARLAGLEISGVLRADNIEPLLQMLEANYQINAVRNADGSITLESGR